MNKLFVFFIFIVSSIYLSSCVKSTDTFIANIGQISKMDTTWYNNTNVTMPVNALKSALQLSTVTDNFIVNNNYTKLTTSSGLELAFPPNTFVSATNQNVVGSLQAHTLFIKSKGDLIRMGLPTIGNNKLLVSDGNYFMEFYKNDTALQITNGNAYTLNYTMGNTYSTTQIFTASQPNIDFFNWKQNTVSSNKVSAVNNSYKVVSDYLQWVNCSHYFDATNVTTNVSINLPAGFTNATTLAYLVFNDINSVVGLYGSANTKTFSTGNIIPVGHQCTIVVISIQGNYYYLGYQAFTPTANGVNVASAMPSISPIKTSLGDIEKYLTAL